MSELVFPHSIDAGTAMVANEVQSNFEAISDVVNGLLQGGSGSDGNLAANGITARELADLLLVSGLPPYGAREGLVTQPSGTTQALFCTPGAGLVINYGAGTAWVRDDSGVLAAGSLIPVVVSASTVTVAANSSGNPRLDQIILTMTGYGTGTVSVLQGTPNAATTLNNRTGAAALPNDAIRLADVLMTNGFAGPFVNHTSLRNRTPWAVPMVFSLSAASELEIVLDSFAEELVTVEHSIETSAYSTLQYQMEGLAGTNYHSALYEQQLLSTGAFSNAHRGAASQTSGVLNAQGNATGSGAHMYTGSLLFNLDVTQAGGSMVLGTGTATCASLTAAGNHVLSGFLIAQRVNTGGAPVTWMKVFGSAGTYTGTVRVDRVPMV